MKVLKTISLSLVFVSMIVLVSSCKKKVDKKVLYKGYVVGDAGAMVYKKTDVHPKQKLTVMLKDTEFEILEEKIPDPKHKEKRLWYEVRQAETIGFMSYDELVVNRSVSIFTAVQKPTGAIVSVSGLNLREKPSTRAKVLTVLKKMELVEVLKQGSYMEAIKDKYDRWLEVKNSAGNIGFIYAGYASIYPLEEAKQALERKETTIDGYFLVTSENPVYLQTPGGSPVSEAKQKDDESHFTLEGFPTTNEFARVSTASVNGGKTYYLVETFYQYDYSVFMQSKGWIEASNGTLMTPTEFSNYTLTSSPDFPPSLVSVLQSKYPNTNFIESKMEPFQLQDPEKRPFSFYIMTVAQGFSTSKGFGDKMLHTCIIKQEGGNYSIVSSDIYGSLQTYDLDSDGIPEVLSSVEERASQSYTLFAYKDGEYKEIKSFSNMDSYVEVSNENKTLTETFYVYDEKTQESKNMVQTYKYDQGELQEVSLVEKK
jgi:hypothetical protein